MIFSVQRFLEDYFGRRGLCDPDQYAISLANVYDQKREGKAVKEFLKLVRRIRTAFYRNNYHLDRIEFEKSIVSILDDKFKKKTNKHHDAFPGGVSKERKQFENNSRRNIVTLLSSFKLGVEARAIDGFWISRKVGRLQKKPERIGQGLLAIFAKGIVLDSGLVMRECLSGTGFVDVTIILSRTPHIIELKILRNRCEGVFQLSKYMRLEKRRVAWLILFDARPQNRRSVFLPKKIEVDEGIINIVVIDINPIAPSRSRT